MAKRHGCAKSRPCAVNRKIGLTISVTGLQTLAARSRFAHNFEEVVPTRRSLAFDLTTAFDTALPRSAGWQPRCPCPQ
jgi:hypothetical protein